MCDSPRPVKYRVIGVREDGRHVPLCVYLSLEIAERIANLALAEATFTQVIIESNEEVVRRARV
jgi:hypothetical protein